MRDKWLRIIGIPLLGLSGPALFEGHIGISSPHYAGDLFVSLLCTALIWEGNRFIVIKLRDSLPWENQPVRRMVTQFLLSSCYAILGVMLVCSLASALRLIPPVSLGNMTIEYVGSVLITLMMNAIYESIYFFKRWRMSFMRAEVLKRTQLRNQYDKLKNQVNPHFLFSCLNTLITLIEEDKTLSVRFVQELAGVYRYVLQGHDNKLTELRDEIHFVEMYVFLLKTRFGENLQIEIDLDKDSRTLIPPLTLQILVENAVKHNTICKDRPLEIRVYSANGQIVVSNNLQVRSVLEKYSKLGIKNIRERYAYLIDKPVEVMQDALSFTVKLPLIQYEEA
jgi:LytS/YehU family sensor histidine kinase